MTGTAIFRRDEFASASLDFGATSIDLADYATTGLRIVTIGPSGIGKTNAGLLVAQQLAEHGWVCVLMDPEGEIETLLGETMRDAAHLESHLRGRHHRFLVVRVRHADDFVHYGRVVLRVADEIRQPVFLMVDEGQMFSTSRRRKEAIGEASDVLSDMAERGRKRALDLFITAHGFTGTLHRSIFRGKNLTFIGRQEDPAAWSALAPQFRGTAISFADLAALAPGEFVCFSRRGVVKVTMPMAAALQAVAPAARIVRPALPATFSEWDRALRAIPTDRLQAVSSPVVELLGAIAGLTTEQLVAGGRALREELETRG